MHLTPHLAEITHRDGTQNTETVWATNRDDARNALRTPDTVVRILDTDPRALASVTAR